MATRLEKQKWFQIQDKLCERIQSQENTNTQPLFLMQVQELKQQLKDSYLEFVNNHADIVKLFGVTEDEYFVKQIDAKMRERYDKLTAQLNAAIEQKRQLEQSRATHNAAAIHQEEQREKELKKQNLIQKFVCRTDEFQQFVDEVEYDQFVETMKFKVDELKQQYTSIDHLFWELADYNLRTEDIKNRMDEAKANYSYAHKELTNKIGMHKNKPKLKIADIQIPSFSGDVNEWSSFHDLFDKMVHKDEDKSGAEKMIYLKTLLKNDAYRLIQHMSADSSNYQAAWKMLNDRYGNQRILFATLVDRILDIPQIDTNNVSSVKQTLQILNESLQSLNVVQDISNSNELLARIILRKLDKAGLMSYEQMTRKPKEIQILDDVLNFLEQQFQVLEATSKFRNVSVKMPESRNSTFGARTLAAADPNCQYCKKSGHGIYVCRSFLKISPKERFNWVKDEQLCFKCMNHKYSIKCPNSMCCETCGKDHHKLLHLSDQQQSSSYSTKSIGKVLLATALVRVKTVDGEYIQLRALIDQGSQTSILSEEAAQIIRLPRQKIDTELFGVGNNKLGGSKSKISVEVRPRFLSNHTFSVEALILPTVASVQPEENFHFEIDQWNNYNLADPSFNRTDRIDMLIGADVYFEILDEGIKKVNGILGQNTKLGWILSGIQYADRQKSKKFVNTIIGLERFWEIEEIHQEEHTTEDEKCMEIYAESLKLSEDGRFSVNLPLKDDKQLGESYKKAMARQLSLEKRLERDDKLREEYVKFMKDYLDRGHMKEVSEPKQGLYYIPHQAVIRECSLTTKVRVVFDASSSTSNGRCLNEIMYVGPRLQKDIFDILINFRLKKFVITADVEKMYRQILINEEHQCYQHILWRESSSNTMKEFVLTTVTYGTAAAPFLAVRTLFEIASRIQDANIQNIIRNHFYMDDLLTGADTLAECRKIKTEISTHFEQYGLHLRKWCSNNSEIINEAESSKEHETVDIENGSVMKVLGLQWMPKEDQLKFQISKSESSKVTKIIALSYLARIFDPLGLLTPVTISAKLFIQKLWLLEMKWDTELNDILISEWNILVMKIEEIEDIRIPRWVQTIHVDYVLLGFSDASERAYAAVVYIKTGNSGLISIVAAKSKVNPVKNRKTLPKLELLAAQLLVRLIHKIIVVMEANPEIHLWSDSMVTLSWIKGNQSKDKFVKTRVSEINSLLPQAEWRYVKSKENPADMASRGIPPEMLKESKLWWMGPEWLLEDKPNWRNYETRNEVLAVMNVKEKNNVICELTENIGSFKKLKRIIAYVLRAINQMRGIKFTTQHLTSEEIWEAEKLILKTHQRDEFNEEIKLLEQDQFVDHRNKIASLNPQIDSEGLLRVGGRLMFANMAYNRKHPIIIKKSVLSQMIIRQIHQETFHGGNKLVENTVRGKYWIIGLKNGIKKCIRSCVRCIRHKKDFKNQLMGILPEPRVNVSHPFTHCGLDYAGPLQIKMSNGRGQKSFKGYVAVFVCLTTKAIHLEAVSSLTSEAFLAALKRFFGRRGKSSHIYSDNGTNFVGAEKILDRNFTLALQNNSRVAQILEEDRIKWHFIPPASPNFGGIWEAAVKSMKYHLRRVIGESKLTYEELSTLLIQIEAVLNSRPITALENDSDTPVLTPGHFLIGRPIIEGPEENKEEKVTCMERWRLIQKMKLQFWKQWKHDYLHTMQQRTKWKTSSKNLQKGEVVIIKNEETHPTKWALGKVIEVHPGPDGVVRVVTLKTENGIIKRPTSKLCSLECNVED